MSVQKITFKNYKSFEQEQVFEIKPITIVIGKNNSGKTALIQLPLMLHAWLQDRNGILSNSFNGVEFAKQMKALIFNSDKNRCLEITFNPHPKIEGILKIGYLEDRFGIFYLEWKYQNKTVWKAEKYGDKYKITTQESEKADYVENLSDVVDGILPNKKIILYVDRTEVGSLDNGEPSYADFPYDLGKLAKTLDIQYFAGIRHSFIDANLSFDDLKYQNFDIKGEFAAHHLYKDADLLVGVQKWYKEKMDGWGIGLDKNTTNEGFYLYLEDFTKENGVKIPITQTGQGITQVFPLVTNTFMRNTNKPTRFWRPINIIIEEPESHIHPAVQGNLLELFAENWFIKHENKSINYILETHSEVMLLRIRRLVAEGKLKPEQVAIYWVDTEEGEAGKRSFLKKIAVDEEGNLEDWPAGVFSEDYNELMHIRKARKK